MTHFHILTGPSAGYPVSNIRYEVYEDSLVDFVSLTKELYSHTMSSREALGLENAVLATDGGDGFGAYVGSPALLVIWARCDEDVCTSPNWN